jgi:class 3 adenylate cyclase
MDNKIARARAAHIDHRIVLMSSSALKSQRKMNDAVESPLSVSAVLRAQRGDHGEPIIEREETRVRTLLYKFSAMLSTISGVHAVFYYYVVVAENIAFVCALSCVLFASAMALLRTSLLGAYSVTVAKCLCLLTMNLGACFCSWVLGKGLGASSLTIPFSVMALLTFPSANSAAPMSLLAVIGTAGAEWLLMNEFDDSWLARRLHQDMSASTTAHAIRWFPMIANLTSVALVTFVIGWMKKLNLDMERDLIQERRTIDKIVLSLLPAQIVSRLKEGEKFIADWHPNVCVLFMDVVGFTAISNRLHAQQVVQGLVCVFTDAEAIIVRHPRVEKIKTIGDALMCASGLRSDNASNKDVIAMADLALEIRDTQFKMIFVDDDGRDQVLPITFRIGFHVGEVVAGVISESRFTYDIVGDTVNTASRMESTGTPGKIHVSDDVKTRLQDLFEFEHCGQKSVKGKGEMKSWFLLRRKMSDIADTF